MTIVSGAVTGGRPTDFARRVTANSMYLKGKSFLGAAILLRRNGGYEYVVLHLMCQGVEVTLKALLLLKNYKRYEPKLKKYGHHLMPLAKDVLAEFQLQPMRPALKAELQALSSLYAKHLLRYGTLHDIFVDGKLIASSLVLRRIVAGVRLAERELRREKGLRRPENQEMIENSIGPWWWRLLSWLPRWTMRWAR
jgi:hypothetical protein